MISGSSSIAIGPRRESLRADLHGTRRPRENPAAERALRAPRRQRGVETELLQSKLQELGYEETQALAARVIELKTGSRYRQMPASGQARIDRLLPRVLEAASVHAHRKLLPTVCSS